MSEAGSVYIHVPFCLKKCRYCDFYSELATQKIPAYLSNLKKEIRQTAKSLEKKSPGLNTLYFGGGTPSVLSVSQVDEVLCFLNQYFPVSQQTEVTFEINPGTVNAAYLKDLKQAGVNRLSIGVQSFLDEKLLFLERIHDAAQAQDAVQDATAAGFENIGIDLMSALFFEDLQMLKTDLEIAAKMELPHLSCYMLTIEPETRLGKEVARGKVPTADPDTVSELFVETSLFLEEKGYDHYEISNFSKGRMNRSKHNSAYWDMVPYIGFGPAAHSFDGKKRSWNPQSLSLWGAAVQSGKRAYEGSEVLTRNQKILEMLMLRLRTKEGLALSAFEKIEGRPFTDIFKLPLKAVLSEGLGQIDQDRFFLNLKGRARLDSILSAFAEQIS